MNINELCWAWCILSDSACLGHETLVKLALRVVAFGSRVIRIRIFIYSKVQRAAEQHRVFSCHFCLSVCVCSYEWSLSVYVFPAVRDVAQLIKICIRRRPISAYRFTWLCTCTWFSLENFNVHYFSIYFQRIGRGSQQFCRVSRLTWTENVMLAQMLICGFLKPASSRRVPCLWQVYVVCKAALLCQLLLDEVQNMWKSCLKFDRIWNRRNGCRWAAFEFTVGLCHIPTHCGCRFICFLSFPVSLCPSVCFSIHLSLVGFVCLCLCISV